ncbi:site-specific integrase [Patulibacter sp. NPDC049589]|uniref:tyrosine-type recombinase/integrase n=1 Tax=Patulibacter sp. NPDC049589 TaxID=3154731 RepID=UPI00343D1D22
MAPRTEGQVLQRTWKAGRGYALRFFAYGERRYLTLGTEHDGWTRRKAQTELQNILADVRRGTWIPPDRNRPAESNESEGEDSDVLLFHRFASERLQTRKLEVSERMHEYETWALTQHLLPYFAHWPVADITIETVDDYRRYKVQQAEQRRDAIDRKKPIRNNDDRILRPLSASSINKTIDVLQSILAIAVEYGHLASNPAAGRRRRLKKPAKRPIHLDNVQQITALLDAAAELDRDTRRPTTDRRAIIATLVLAGPRAHELCWLLWRDVDLANGRIHIGRSKTQAGLREIHLLPLLRDELRAHKARSTATGPDDLVFPNARGRVRDIANLRNRVLAAALARADELLAQRGDTPLPAGATPHKLRHTFASILVACGEDPASVMAQLGHTDPKFTLRVYTHLMRRDPAERARLKALVLAEPTDPPTTETDADEQAPPAGREPVAA